MREIRREVTRKGAGPPSCRGSRAGCYNERYAEHYNRSHGAVIRVYDDAGNMIETHQHAGDFEEL